jgi:hypothetical protein
VLAVTDFIDAVLNTHQTTLQKNLDGLVAKMELVKEPAEALPARLAANVPYALKHLKEMNKQGE